MTTTVESQESWRSAVFQWETECGPFPCPSVVGKFLSIIQQKYQSFINGKTFQLASFIYPTEKSKFY